jgi:DNA-binding HxlR family transcriptional regulator
MTGELDPRSAWTASRCSIARTLEVVGARSTFVILREAFYGTTRFDDFVERAGLSESVTAGRLKELVAEGLLEREDYREPGQRTRRRYRLTAKGADLVPTLVSFMQWGDRWLAGDGGAVELQHRDCGEPVGVELRCAAGHPVGADELDLAVPNRSDRRSRTA